MAEACGWKPIYSFDSPTCKFWRDGQRIGFTSAAADSSLYNEDDMWIRELHIKNIERDLAA